MQITQWNRPWMRYLGIAVAYAAIFGVLRIFWFANWQLTAGFRIACLLLVPRRYWPALFVGEAIGLSKFAYDCAGQLGLAWALATPFTAMPLAMLAIALFNSRWPVIDASKRIAMNSLLACTLVTALLNTGANVLLFALMNQQNLTPDQVWTPAHLGYFSYLWFLGASLGIYMVVPLTLWACTEGDLHDIRSRIIRSRVLRETVVLFLAGLYTLAYIAQYSHWEWMRHAAQLGMLLAPAWLATRYGWQGAALGSMLTNVCVVLTMPAFQDATLVQTQGMMLVSSTLWLLVGARRSIAKLRHVLAH